MKVVVLCAGLGTRLRPHTLTRPKPLLSVAGHPALWHILHKLQELEQIPRFAGKQEYIFVIGYLGEQIIEFVQKTFPNLQVQFVEQPQPLGSGEATVRTREVVLAQGDTDLFLLYSDTIFDMDFRILANLPPDLDGVVSWRKAEDTSSYGAVVVDETSGLVTKLVEKPKVFVSDKAVTSPYYFTSAQKLFIALDELLTDNRQTNGEFYLTDAVQIMLEKNAKLLGQNIPLWLDTGNFESWLASNKALLEQTNQSGPRPSGDSLIIEPCFIASDVTLQNSIVGPYVAIGVGANVKESIISDSIIEAGAQIVAANLRHSVIGRNTIWQGQISTNLSIGDFSKVTSNKSEV